MLAMIPKTVHLASDDRFERQQRFKFASLRLLVACLKKEQSCMNDTYNMHACMVVIDSICSGLLTASFWLLGFHYQSILCPSVMLKHS